jgi:large subunit ribosomal protein L24e
MVKCSFSGKEIPKGTGIMYIKKDGTVMHFFSSKEKKNFLKLGREGRRVKWTPAARQFKVDSAIKAKKEVKAPAVKSKK